MEESPLTPSFSDTTNNNGVLASGDKSLLPRKDNSAMNIVPKLNLGDKDISRSLQFEVKGGKPISQSNDVTDAVSADYIQRTSTSDLQSRIPDTVHSDQSLSNRGIFDDALNSNSDEPSVINFGAKEVDISKYPDYYIGEKPNSPRRKWEVQTESYSSRAEIVNRNELQQAEEEVSMT